jgi:aspartate kinase
MKSLVQKFGGSSLASVERLRAVADRVAAAHRTERPVVVVVSARGRTTDALLELAGTLNPRSPAREVDQLLSTGESSSAAQLAMVLDAAGVPAASLTGVQAGVRVTGPHGAGRIADIAADRVHRLLRKGFVPVIAGFQGIDADGDVVTLGRGGSDTTAVAVAAAIGAERCEINTDVDGVFTADPRVVRAARVLSEVDCAVMAEMARTGAKVLHSRSVELARARGVEVHVRNSANDAPGTVLVRRRSATVENSGSVVAVTHDEETAAVSIHFGQRAVTSLPEVLDLLAGAAVEADLLTRVCDGTDELARFTVPRGSLADTRAVLAATGLSAAGAVRVDPDVGKVSVVGGAAVAADAAVVLRALAAVGIRTTSVHTAPMRVSALVPRADLTASVEVLHTAFGLDADQEPAGARLAAVSETEPR